MRTLMMLALLAVAAPAVAEEPKDARLLFAEALAHEQAGRADEARGLYVQIVEAEPDHAAARRALGYVQVEGRWLSTAQAFKARGLVKIEGRWTLPQAGVAPDARQLRHWIRDAASPAGASARRRLAALGPRARRAALIAALASRSPASTRAYAADALSGDPDAAVTGALVRTALKDGSARVRSRARDALVDRDGATDAFVGALSSRALATRVRAAEALATLREERAMVHLVNRWALVAGDFPRSYFSQVTQQNYVSDFDVEVA